MIIHEGHMYGRGEPVAMAIHHARDTIKPLAKITSEK